LGATRRILIVDDDAGLRESLAMLVELVERKCAVAASLEEARGFLRELPEFDLAILDVNLGEGLPSGLDVHRWLSENGFRGKVVFFTGHARSHPLLRKACELPGVELLEKPASFERLQRLVEGSR
jgi:DNA-binding NtrC family response regulator